MRIHIVLLYTFLRSKSIKLTFLYEKEIPSSVNDFYLNYLQNLISKYNDIFIQEQIRLHLDDLIPFNEYININKYYNLIDLAGTDDIEERFNELRKISDTHVILGASTASDDSDATQYNYYSPCNSIFIFNLNSKINQEKELAKVFSNVLIELLSNIFIIDIPDLSENTSESEINEFKEKLSKSEIIKYFNDCSINEEEEDDKNNDKLKKYEKICKLYDELKKRNLISKENDPVKSEGELEQTIKQLSSQVSNIFNMINLRKSNANTKDKSIKGWPIKLMNNSLNDSPKEDSGQKSLSYGITRRNVR
ncbi:hypothetical protein H312_00714 [Anncaliia algerae PRA339]|uniref:Uncharacterized protein n=1 Tax=Anncaliia algerae PRA339 TaxID=1288291 RepID=A0A059F3M5_9MICR|nr:hypothetical protein H312_00714 [Anncaliia algerae PRA339]